MIRILTLLTLLAPALSLCAQEGGRPPISNVPRTEPVPVLELSYYAGHEGAGFQEFIRLELDEWTPQKDIIITAKWIPKSGLTSPGANVPRDLRRYDPFKRRLSRVPTHRSWHVEYTDAVTEGESHFFIDAPGLPRISRQIRSADDFLGFAHMPGFGWYEVRAAARAFRYRTPPEQTENPDTPAPSPSDTQDPFDTRSR